VAVVAHPETWSTASRAPWLAGRGGAGAKHPLTSGEAGTDGMPPDKAGPLREDEGAGAPRPSACHNEFSPILIAAVEYGVALRRDLAAPAGVPTS
jgi:hypothetical protein